MSRGQMRWGVGVKGIVAVIAATALCVLTLSSSAIAAPPKVPLTTFSAVTATTATLEADIDTGEKATLYRFEFGLTDCSSDTCTTVPGSEAELSPSKPPVRVTAALEGLSPGTTYHFRAVAMNGEGEVKGPDRSFTTQLAPPIFPECPSPTHELRAGPSGDGPGLKLPDCRAYERASPAAKNGTSLMGELAPLKAAIDGSAVSFESSSGIPGGEGAQDFPFYLAQKGKEEWSTQGLLPDAKAGPKASVTGWTRDFATAYVAVGKPVLNESGYFARSSADGSLTPIVDYTPGELTPFFAGAAADGSKVFFEADAELSGLPAAPGETNLYAWDRESEELSLAGVLPEGEEAPPGGAFAGPYDWVNGTTPTTLSRGGASANYYTQDDHAISTEGDRVFFTAGDTGQLYLREDPTSEEASTVHVSASERTEGSGPGGRDSAGTRPAAFQAATADGSKVFFTSTEKLTNDATTGPEPTSFAAIAQAEIDGSPVDQGFLPTSAFGVALDDTFIYWADPVKGTIGRAKLDGTEPDEDFIAAGVGSPQYVAVDDEFIYWTNTGPLNEKGEAQDGLGTVGRAKLNGTEPDEDFITGASNPQGIAVNATHVFWANAQPMEFNSGAIGRAKLDGSEASQKFFKFSGIDELPQGIAVNAVRIYWTVTKPNGFVKSRTLDGDPVSEKSLFIDFNTPMHGIALDATHVYWANRTADAIGRAKLDFTTPEQEFIKEAGRPKGLAANATHLYWSANQEVEPNPGNDLYRYDVEAEALTDLVVDDDANGAEVRGVLGAAEDGSRLYFAANGDLDGVGPATKGDCSGPPVGGTGECNLYLWEEDSSADGAITFVARLDTDGKLEGDSVNWAATPAGVFSIATEKTARISSDGSVLLFRSQRSLGSFKHDGTPHFYRYDATEKALLCISCNQTGEAPVGGPTLGSARAFLIGTGRPTSLLTRNLSAKGDRVFFESTEALVAEDTNGAKGCPLAGSKEQSFPACRDLYLWEAKGTGSCKSEAQNGGCLYLLSTGKSPEPSFFADASATGDEAFLLTSSQLVPADGDQLYDVYDASVEGGLDSQNQPLKDPCSSVDSCHEGPTIPPATGSPSTPGFTGPSDPPPVRKACPKGKRKARVKGKSRCVAKRRKGAAKQRQRRNRGAKTTGRAGR